MENKKRSYQLAIQFPLIDAAAEVFDRIIMLERELSLTLTGKHLLEEHVMGEDSMSILINTADPAEAFELARKEISEKDLGTILVAIKNINSDQYAVIWPEDYQGEFKTNSGADKKLN